MGRWMGGGKVSDFVTLGPIERASSKSIEGAESSTKKHRKAERVGLAPAAVYGRENLLRLSNFVKKDPTTGFEYASERSAKSTVADTEDRFSYGPYACEYDDKGAESPTKKRKNNWSTFAAAARP